MNAGPGVKTERGVVSSLVRQPLGVLTMSMLASDLLRMPTWSERLAFLERNPTLVHQAVADRCRAEGDARLGDFIERAASVGVNQATQELRAVEALAQVAEAESGAQTAELEAVAALILAGATWLTSAFLAAATSICARNPDVSPAVREVVIPPLAHTTGTTVADIKGILALATLDWEDVWPTLERLAAQEHLRGAFPAALAVAGISADLPRLRNWVSELCSLIEAATIRGPEAAIAEHQLRICVWSFTERDGLDDLEESEDPATCVPTLRLRSRNVCNGWVRCGWHPRPSTSAVWPCSSPPQAINAGPAGCRISVRPSRWGYTQGSAHETASPKLWMPPGKRSRSVHPTPPSLHAWPPTSATASASPSTPSCYLWTTSRRP